MIYDRFEGKQEVSLIRSCLTHTEHAFNVLNMRSVPVADTDQTTRSRIRDHAFRLFADQGFQRVSGRAIARAAGVSPALVIHHFGSISQLRREIDRWVMDNFNHWMQQAADGTSAEQIADDTIREVRDLFRAEPLLGSYLRQLLVEGDEPGYEFFAELFSTGRQLLEQLQQRNLVRPPAGDDQEARLMLLLAEDLGAMMLEPYLSRLLGVDLYSDEFMDRWRDAELDLHANGLFAAAPTEGANP